MSIAISLLLLLGGRIEKNKAKPLREYNHCDSCDNREKISANIKKERTLLIFSICFISKCVRVWVGWVKRVRLLQA